MKTSLRIVILMGFTGWVILLLILTATYLYRDELRASRYWAMDRAASSGDTALVRFLLFVGADPSGENDYRTFINEGGHLEFSSPLSQASWKGSTEVVRMLLDAGANPNKKEGEGWTPFLAAAEYGHKKTVVLLLQRGADPGIRRPDGLTAAENARNQNEVEILQAIEQYQKK